MQDQDPRKLYLISQVKNIFQLKDIPKDLINNPNLEDFLNSVNISAIRISKDENSHTIAVEKVDSSSGSSKSSAQGLQVFISKVRNEEISQENMREQLIINTINDNPLVALLNNLQNVYLPTLQNQKWADQLDNNLKRLLDELKVGLDNTLTKGTKTGGAVNIFFNSLRA